MQNRGVHFLHGGDWGTVVGKACGDREIQGERLREKGKDVDSVDTHIQNLLEEEERRSRRWYRDLGDPACQKYTRVMLPPI